MCADETTWPGVTSLPDYVPFAPSAPEPIKRHFSAASAETISLLQGLLTFNPGERMTAENALLHRYFRGS